MTETECGFCNRGRLNGETCPYCRGSGRSTTTYNSLIYNEDEHRPDHAVELFRITKEYGRD